MLVLLLIVRITWLVLYVVYRPTGPTVTVVTAAILGLYNATNVGPTMGRAHEDPGVRFALVLCNPSTRSSAHYDRLTAYTAYRGEPLTTPAPLPPLEQDAGTAVTVAPVLAALEAWCPCRTMQRRRWQPWRGVPFRVVLLGRIKFVSGPFHI